MQNSEASSLQASLCMRAYCISAIKHTTYVHTYKKLRGIQKQAEALCQFALYGVTEETDGRRIKETAGPEISIVKHPAHARA
jgi:hypothetical protein